MLAWIIPPAPRQTWSGPIRSCVAARRPLATGCDRNRGYRVFCLVGPGWPDDAVERARARVGRALFGARADVRPIVGRFEVDGVLPPPGVSARFVATDPITTDKVVLQF